MKEKSNVELTPKGEDFLTNSKIFDVKDISNIDFSLVRKILLHESKFGLSDDFSVPEEFSDSLKGINALRSNGHDTLIPFAPIGNLTVVRTTVNIDITNLIAKNVKDVQIRDFCIVGKGEEVKYTNIGDFIYVPKEEARSVIENGSINLVFFKSVNHLAYLVSRLTSTEVSQLRDEFTASRKKIECIYYSLLPEYNIGGKFALNK